MPFDIESFARLRPRLYHLTARTNAQRILRDKVIHPASDLFLQSHRRDLLAQRRKSSINVEVGNEQVHVRDQAPLHEGNTALQDGWSFSDLVSYLNQHVFFWPGDQDGPITYGRNHFARYASEDAVVLVFDSMELLTVNGFDAAAFSKCNSGSPRYNKGRPGSRGRDTFLPAASYAGTPGTVAEVVFRRNVSLKGLEIHSGPVARFVSEAS